MEFISGVENATRKIRTTICAWTPISLHPPRLPIRHIDTLANPSRMRLQVLRRDRYRCRSCNRVGDEITLEVLPIWPRASTIEEMLTLCVHCKKLVEQWNIKPSIDFGLLNNSDTHRHFRGWILGKLRFLPKEKKRNISLQEAGIRMSNP